jgi:hypothetical protein
MSLKETRRFLIQDFRWAMDRSKLLGPFKKDPKMLDSLVKVVENLEEYPLPEYGSYALTHLQKQKVDLTKYRKQFIDTIFKTDNQSVLRNLVNILQQQELSDYRESELIDLLIGFLNDPKNKVALHVYSIYFLLKFIHKYPELKDEVEQVIELNSEGKTAGWKVAKRNFYKWTK